MLRALFLTLLLLISLYAPALAQHPAASPLTAAERNWLSAHQPIVFGFPTGYEPALIDQGNGRYSGFVVDLLQLINHRLGSDFQLQAISPTETQQLLAEHKLAGHFAIREDAAKSIGLLVSRPHLSATPTLYARSKTVTFTRLEDLIGKRVAVAAGTRFATEVLAPLGEQVEILPAPTPREALKLVFERKADAMLGLTMHTRLISEYQFYGIVPVHLFSRQRFYAVVAVRPDLPRLLTIINKGLALVSREEIQQIQQRWINPDNKQQALTLTAAERLWLQQHPVLRVAFDSAFAPVEFLAEDGTPQGISADYLQLLGKKLGVRFEIPPQNSWHESLEQLKAGRLELASAVQETPERRKFLDFTSSYLTLPISIYALDHSPYIGNLDQLAGKQVAVVGDYPVFEDLRRDFPQLQLIGVRDAKQGLQLVAEQQADAYIGSQVVTGYYLARLGLSRLKVVGDTPYDYHLSMAGVKGQPLLTSALEKGLAAINAEERNRIFQRWFSVRYEHRFDPTLLYQVGIPLLALLALIGFWNLRLGREIRLRKQTEKELLEARDAAEAASRAKGRFLASMSHELRTPLTAILGYSHLLQRRGGLPDDVQKKLQTINRSGQHLGRMISDVLELSRIEEGRSELRCEPFDLHRFLAELREMFAYQASEKGLQLEFNLVQDLPLQIETDLEKLRQILINLLGNACKFSDRGSVRLSASGQPLDSGYELRISVSDTGPGISAEEQQRLFQPFEQGAAGHSKGGTGLGLVISRQFARLMGGDLLLQSVPGEGAEFTLVCRVALPQGALPQQQTDLDFRRFSGQQVLVVDDDREIRNLLLQLFSESGVQADSASDGEEALTMLETATYDLVVLDIQLPKLDGFAVLRQLQERTQRPPVLAISASVLREERERVLQAGADAFLAKPLAIDAFHAQLEKLLFPAAKSSGLKKLGELDEELRKALQLALDTLDPAKVDAAVADIRKSLPELGEELAALARDFRYDTIREGLHETD